MNNIHVVTLNKINGSLKTLHEIDYILPFNFASQHIPHITEDIQLSDILSLSSQ